MEAAAGLAAGAAVLLGLCALLYYNLALATRCRNAVSLRGKTVLITGGNTGIGKATAVDLARRGARVILACRDKARGESAVCDIRRESGNSEVILMILDLASLNSVRAFAQTFLKSEPRLDILINNAGVFKDGQTTDGFDENFQVNHLGHFLLTHLLLDRLKRCAPSRVVILASSMHSFGKIDFRKIYKPAEGMWQVIKSYSNSKLANVLHARELANRLEGTNVTCYAVDPGKVGDKVVGLDEMDYLDPLWTEMAFVVLVNDLWQEQDMGGASILALLDLSAAFGAMDCGSVRTELGRSFPWWVFRVFGFMKLFRRDCNTGAQTTIYCATEEGIERLSGQYFVDCHAKAPWPQARDDHMATKLWEFSERLLGLTT